MSDSSSASTIVWNRRSFYWKAAFSGGFGCSGVFGVGTENADGFGDLFGDGSLADRELGALGWGLGDGLGSGGRCDCRGSGGEGSGDVVKGIASEDLAACRASSAPSACLEIVKRVEFRCEDFDSKACATFHRSDRALLDCSFWNCTILRVRGLKELTIPLPSAVHLEERLPVSQSVS